MQVVVCAMLLPLDLRDLFGTFQNPDVGGSRGSAHLLRNQRGQKKGRDAAGLAHGSRQS
jgi:hypothetical protein